MIGDEMKKDIIGIGVILIFMPAILGLELPSTESVELKNCDDSYIREYTESVWVKKESTYEMEARTIQVSIKPLIPWKYEKDGASQEDREHFLKVSVSVTVTGLEGELSPFEGSLMYEQCEEVKEGRLFWSFPSGQPEDLANKTLGKDAPSTVVWDDLVVTVALTNVTPSEHHCESGNQLCGPRPQCIVYMDALILQVTVAYSPDQESIRSQFEEAEKREKLADDLFERGDFENAREEYDQARNIYDHLGDTVRSSKVQEKIKACDFRGAATDDFAKGEELRAEASKIESSDEAIEKYENAIKYYRAAKAEFDEVGDIEKSRECQKWINQCNNEIDNLEKAVRFKSLLTYFVVGVVVVAGVAAAAIIVMRKRRPPVKRLPPIRRPEFPEDTTVRPSPVPGRRPRIVLENQTHNITSDSVTIGRGENADIKVPDPEKLISRIHARIYRDDMGQYWIADSNSANGTFILRDGEYKRIKKWLLYDGDTIVLSYMPSRGVYVKFQFKAN